MRRMRGDKPCECGDGDFEAGGLPLAEHSVECFVGVVEEDGAVGAFFFCGLFGRWFAVVVTLVGCHGCRGEFWRFQCIGCGRHVSLVSYAGFVIYLWLNEESYGVLLVSGVRGG